MSGKIFGLGLSRTGTRSLTVALRLLGYNAVHFPEENETFFWLMNGIFDIPEINEHDAITDVQVVRFFKNLDVQYPGSKFILTVRDKEDWLRSTKKHFRGEERYERKDHEILTKASQNLKLFWLRSAVYGTPVWDRELFSNVYDEHVINCTKYFKKRSKSFLIMDICAGQGWNVLCPFLGKDVPDMKFPYKHRKPYRVPVREDK